MPVSRASMVDEDAQFVPALKSDRSLHVLHQLVCIGDINFDNRSFTGYVELAVVSTDAEATSVYVNCHPQCSVSSVTVNEEAAQFSHTSFEELLPESNTEESLAQQLKRVEDKYTAELGHGELCISLPSSSRDFVSNNKVIRVAIEYSVASCCDGLLFTSSLFSCMQDSARYWMPCVDSYSAVCTWKLEWTVPASLTVVCSGDLDDTVSTASDPSLKTCHYFVRTPTAAANIGFAISAFEVYMAPDSTDTVYFFTPGYFDLVTHTVSTMDKVFEVYEELLAARYPFNSYKQVFIDVPSNYSASFATLACLSTSILFSPNSIDDVICSRRLLALAAARQFFGCFVAPATAADLWITEGLARYVAGMASRRFFGNNEYTHQMYEVSETALKYEEKYYPIQLAADDGEPAIDCCTDWQVRAHKAHFVINLIEKKLGRENFARVLAQLMSVQANAAEQHLAPVTWIGALLNPATFCRCISSVTGQDMANFFDQWVYSAGHAYLHVSFKFNRKRNLIEMSVEQPPAAGSCRYVGPVQILVQELDGAFTHTIQIDDTTSSHELPCHSKARKQKRKKIALANGEEVEMDIGSLDQDSTILWLRFDPDMKLFRRVKLEQIDYHLQYQLRYERDVVAQLESLKKLVDHPTGASRMLILETIESACCFHRVRSRACLVAAEMSERAVASWSAGAQAMIELFRRQYGSQSDPTIVRCNNFDNFQVYFLQVEMIRAIAHFRSSNDSCISDIHTFLLDLLKTNDNRQNNYMDDHYRAHIIDALATAVGVAANSITSIDYEPVVQECWLHLNLEKLMPSYKCVVTISCLRLLTQLAIADRIEINPTILLAYVRCDCFWPVREAALACLTQLCYLKCDIDLLLVLLDEIFSARGDISLQHCCAHQLSATTRNSISIKFPISQRDDICGSLLNIVAARHTSRTVRQHLTDVVMLLRSRQEDGEMEGGQSPKLDFFANTTTARQDEKPPAPAPIPAETFPAANPELSEPSSEDEGEIMGDA